MKTKHRQFGFELKSLDDKGAFAGYGSVFGNADLYRDVVMPGAFAASLGEWQERGQLPPILWQHDSTAPIGPFTKMAEDGKGLYVEGQLLIGGPGAGGKFAVKKAKEAYALLQAGAISGMSIGYTPVDEEYDGKTNVNRVLAVDLWEVSIVTFPANRDATVSQIKTILESGNTPTIREFESFLRDAGGYSRKHAERIKREGYAAFLKQRDADEGQLDTQRVESMLALFDHPLKL